MLKSSTKARANGFVLRKPQSNCKVRARLRPLSACVPKCGVEQGMRISAIVVTKFSQSSALNTHLCDEMTVRKQELWDAYMKYSKPNALLRGNIGLCQFNS